MPTSYRFSEFQRAAGTTRPEARFGQLFPEPERDANGRILRLKPVVSKVTSQEVVRLLQPYVASRFGEQCRAVIPLAVYLVLFQLLILRERRHAASEHTQLKLQLKPASQPPDCMPLHLGIMQACCCCSCTC